MRISDWSSDVCSSDLIPFFCIAGVWQRGTREYPDAFAALTVPAYPDLAEHRDRHVAVVDPDDWFDWLQQVRPPLDILRPFPEGSFTIMPPINPTPDGLPAAACKAGDKQCPARTEAV